MKAHYEKVTIDEGASWRFFHRQLEAIPFEWHYHPEYELTLTVNSHGKRYVGDHIGEYQSGDLALIGPNLPHSWQSLGRPNEDQPQTAYVLWFSQSWVDHLISGFPEYQPLHHLLQAASRGLVFEGGWPENRLSDFEALVTATPRERLNRLLQLFDHLLDLPHQPLASPAYNAAGLAHADQAQLNLILDRLHSDFAQPLTADQLANEVHMSLSTFNRFFRRQMKQSLHQYLTQIRLGHACSELIGTNLPIALIAERSGFRNLANFNRLFLKYRGHSPSVFRRSFGQG